MSSTLPSRAKVAGAESSARGANKSTKSVSAQNDMLVVPACFTSVSFPAHTGLTIDQASTGDHLLIHQLLQSVLGGPTQPQFQAQLDYPLYEPADRLVARYGKQVVGHLLVAKSTANCLAESLPIAVFHDLCVLPEFKGKGIKAALLNAAEIQARQEGAIFALMRTGNPKPLMRAGWAAYGRYSYTRARARDVLSHLAMLRDGREENVLPVVNAQSTASAAMTVRLWRHIEEAALLRLYDHMHCHLGLTIRNEAHWRWLISTAGHDRIYIAIKGPDKLELEGQLDPIVGYAVVKDDRIIELVSSPGHEDEVALELLGRACRDAIERGANNLQMEAPTGSRVHQLLVAANGNHSVHEVDEGQVTLAKLFEPFEYMQRIKPFIHQRAVQADINYDLGLLMGEDKLRITTTENSITCTSNKMGRNYLQCSPNHFAQMLLGHIDVAEAVAANRISASTNVAVKQATVLFPQMSIWRSAWDEIVR